MAWRAYAYQAADEGIVFYPLYALFFADHGLSTADIGTLFVLWSVAVFVLEIPSGAWADLVDRRLLLAFGPVLRAVGFALWVAWPTYPGFAIGFLLWSVDSAITSGTFEALVYDELAAAGGADRYAHVIGRARAASSAAIVVATALATPVLRLGGYRLVVVVSIAVGLLPSVVAATFPARPRVAPADGPRGVAAYGAMLAAGTREAARVTAVRRLVVLASLLSAAYSLDEYVPLLARSTGVPQAYVPLVVSAQMAAMAAGAVLAGRFAGAPPRLVGGLLLATGLAVTAGVATGHPAGLVAVVAFIGAVIFADVLAENRLQQVIDGPARATVISVSCFGSEVLAAVVYGAVGLGSTRFPLPVVAAAVGLVALPAAVAAVRSLGAR